MNKIISAQTEEKFDEIISKLRERFVLFGAKIYIFDPDGDDYRISIVKEADGLTHGFRVSMEWFDESSGDEIVSFFEARLEEANFHEYGNHKVPLVFFNFEEHIKGEERIKCKDCPAYINADGKKKCWHHAIKPGTKTEPETECLRGMTRVPKDYHIGYTLKIE